MKKFLIDTYRIFLLQTSKVIWDIIGCTFIIWLFFYYNATNNYSHVSFLGVLVGLWMALRLYWPRGRRKLEEFESLRPVSLLAPEIGTFLVLIFFCLLIYGTTGFFYYDFRFARLTLWLSNNFDINISKSIIKEYSNSEISFSQADLIKQSKEIFSAIWPSWIFLIPVAVALRLKMKFRILFIILVVLSVFTFGLDLNFIIIDTCYSYIKESVFYLSYLLMIIYLLIPKKVNFK